MWYFAWMLGLPLAAAFAVLNAMWLELRSDAQMAEEADAQADDRADDRADHRRGA